MLHNYYKYKHIARALLVDCKNKTYPQITVHGNWNEWLPRFIYERICKKYDIRRRISCFSVYSYPEILRYSFAKYKFFQTAENTHVFQSKWQQFEYIHRKEKSLSLSLGFDFLEEDSYLRFPYWLMANFGPLITSEDIKQFVSNYNSQRPTTRKEFCSFICRKDYFGDRAVFADLIESISPIMYPSDFRHNDDRMRDDFNDSKVEYLKLFKFNLCPENSNNRGYVTEKVFDAIKSGCVPIYWGNEGYPETDILNKDAIIYLDKENQDKCNDALKLIAFLNENSKAYIEFASQPRFVDGAAEVIFDYFNRLEKRLIDILKN